ncbi:hypothetical protein B9T62_18715 [Paenibacillus donghaensis]|uniref:Uncharacterized protein n=2 Tax=Paenibacillus donghaensis TaxID=414771 RepID=A0A2Z2KQM7_9BACL|nr:hypothetical protein B9T62_18715 [Paenibacillus donghaensis]
MKLIENWEQINKNIYSLEVYKRLDTHRKEYNDYIVQGICFVVTLDNNGDHIFSPSRFIGYEKNSFVRHKDNENKHGRETNDIINKTLGKEPVENERLLQIYKEFCERNEIEYREKGAFGSTRKFWVYN